MQKGPKVFKDKKEGNIVRFISNSIHDEMLERTNKLPVKVYDYEDDEIKDLSPISVVENWGYIQDIKNECQGLSKEVNQTIISELTKKDIKYYAKPIWKLNNKYST